jgi:hypothetical protein
MRRGTSRLPNIHIESDALPFRYIPGQPAAHVLRLAALEMEWK